MAALDKSADKHLDNIATAFRKSSDVAEASAKATSDATQKMADKVSMAKLRVTRAHELEAEALKKVIATSNDVDFARISGDTDKLAATQKRLDIALRDANSAMRETVTAAKGLASAESDMEKSGGRLGKAFQKGLSSNMVRLAPALAPVAVVAGAAMGEAVVLGFGGVLIGLGVASAKGFGHVKNEYEELRKYVAAQSRTFFEPFGQSLIDIRHMSEDTFDLFGESLDNASDRLAPALTKFTGDLLEGLGNLEPAIEPMSRAIAKVMDDLGERLPNVMVRIERGMTALAESIEENPETLGDLVEGLSLAIEYSLKFVAAIHKMYEPIRNTVTWLRDLTYAIVNLTSGDLKWGLDKELENTTGAAKGSTEALDKNRKTTEELEKAQKDAAEAAQKHADRLRDLTEATYDQLGAALNLQDAQDNGKDAVKEYNEAVKDHGKHSEEATDALRDLKRASLDLAESSRDNALAQQMAAGKTTDLLAANIAARNALSAFASSLKGPARDAVMSQIEALNALIAKLQAIPGTYAAKVQITVSQTGKYSGPPVGAMLHFARGGSIGPGEIGRVAENEPEMLTTAGKSYLLMNNAPGQITPVSKIDASAKQGTHGNASPTSITVVIDANGLRGMDRAVADSLQAYITRTTGGDVQKALGRDGRIK
jgi:hypothetical protein